MLNKLYSTSTFFYLSPPGNALIEKCEMFEVFSLIEEQIKKTLPNFRIQSQFKILFK